MNNYTLFGGKSVERNLNDKEIALNEAIQKVVNGRYSCTTCDRYDNRDMPIPAHECFGENIRSLFLAKEDWLINHD